MEENDFKGYDEKEPADYEKLSTVLETSFNTTDLKELPLTDIVKRMSQMNKIKSVADAVTSLTSVVAPSQYRLYDIINVYMGKLYKELEMRDEENE